MLTLELNSEQLCVFELAQMLRIAPALQVFNKRSKAVGGDPGSKPIRIICSLGASIAADLAMLQQNMHIDILRSATYCFCFFSLDRGPRHPSKLSSLPQMVGVSRCELSSCDAEELLAMANTFPDVEELTVKNSDGVSDMHLQALAACGRITTLTLVECMWISPMGLHALCQRLPRLLSVTVQNCVQIQQHALRTCGELLQGRVSLVEAIKSNSWY